MKNTFVTLWPRNYCNFLKRSKDAGPIEVIYGGEHQSMPSISSIRVGDTIIPLAISDGSLYLVARMTVSRIEDPSAYMEAEYGLRKEPGIMWDSFLELIMTQPENLGHRIPRTCPTVAAVGIWGSEIRFDRKVPESILPVLKFGPKDKETKIIGIENGKLKSSVSFNGNVRRASVESTEMLERLFATV